jgi:WhiB family redox-sensing transcriptional regulator
VSPRLPDGLDMPLLDGALCVQVDTGDMFFVPKGGSTRQAKIVCGRCPVRAECLQYALDNPVEGVWGGTSAQERRVFARAAGRSYNTVVTPGVLWRSA